MDEADAGVELTAHDPYALPADLPVPVDDGAADHIEGTRLPSLLLPTTRGAPLDVGGVTGTFVMYIYPSTGKPGEPPPDGWDAIPGARGCTPQSCAFRDHHAELRALGATVAGLSAQTSDDQAEFAERSHIPFALCSDPTFRLAEALGLPTFEVDGMRLYKRLTLIAEERVIAKVFYPVFPPDQNAQDVLDWLSARYFSA